MAKYIPYDKNSKSAPAKTREQQDVDARKDREADKGRFNKQVENAKAEAGMASASKQYAKSTPKSDTVVDKIMTASPVTPQHDFKGDTSLDTASPKSKSDIVSTPKAKPVVKDVPKTKSKLRERMRDAYASFGGSGDTAENQAIQKRLSGGMANYKSGGMVKSSASRGDGIAQRGKTRGRIC